MVPWGLRPADVLTQSSKASSTVWFADYEYATAPADKTDHNVVVAKAVKSAPSLHATVTMTSACFGLLVYEPETARARMRVLVGSLTNHQSRLWAAVLYASNYLVREIGVYISGHNFCIHARKHTACRLNRNYLVIIRLEPGFHGALKAIW